MSMTGVPGVIPLIGMRAIGIHAVPEAEWMLPTGRSGRRRSGVWRAFEHGDGGGLDVLAAPCVFEADEVVAVLAAHAAFDGRGLGLGDARVSSFDHEVEDGDQRVIRILHGHRGESAVAALQQVAAVADDAGLHGAHVAAGDVRRAALACDERGGHVSPFPR